MTDPTLPSSPTDVTFDRYLAGQASSAECVLVDRWLSDDRRRMTVVAALHSDISTTATDLRALDERIQMAIHKPMPQAPHTAWRPIQNWWGARRDRTLAGAAALAVMILIAAVFIHRVPFVTLSTTTHTYATSPGQQTAITLADGSRAILGAATHLTVTTGHTGTNVTVDGQVLFTVAHHTPAPFTVRAGAAVTRVIGTTFLIRRYASDRYTRVVVTDGRVVVHRYAGSSGADAILSARTLGVVPDSGSIQVTPNIALEDYTAWTTGRLVFRDTPLADVVAEIGRTYNMDIRLADSTLATHPLTLTIPVATQSAGQVLRVLEAILDARVIRSGRVVTIASGHSAVRPSMPTLTFTPEARYGR